MELDISSVFYYDNQDEISELNITHLTKSDIVNKDLADITAKSNWNLSSSKPGNGLKELRSTDLTQYWQSDGNAPHTIEISFIKRIYLSEIWIYLDSKSDESYTPNKILVRAKNLFGDLISILKVNIIEDYPTGWFRIQLKDGNSIENECLVPYIKTNQIQLIFLQNLHGGKDTHLRGVKLFEYKMRSNYKEDEERLLKL